MDILALQPSERFPSYCKDVRLLFSQLERRFYRSGLILKLAEPLFCPTAFLDARPAPILPFPLVLELSLVISTTALSPAIFLLFVFFRGGEPSERQIDSSSSEMSSMMSEVKWAAWSFGKFVLLVTTALFKLRI